jgi:glycosyltransferase involved in cell wall biosynthesis
MYAKYVLHKIRLWDVATVNRVDHFIANSKFIAERIKKTYNRESIVIYPPVNTDFFSFQEAKEDYYFTASRMVSYKKIQLIVETFNELPNHKLIVGGKGPDFEKIKKIAKPNIQILGYTSEDELKQYMQKAKAFVFAAEEDFGIVPVEAQSCGTPVIAFGKGGALETVIDGETGLFFHKQDVPSLLEAIEKFEKLTFNYTVIRENALKYSKQRFEKEMKEFVEEQYRLFKIK